VEIDGNRNKGGKRRIRIGKWEQARRTNVETERENSKNKG
jgi:hypothetical protein